MSSSSLAVAPFVPSPTRTLAVVTFHQLDQFRVRPVAGVVRSHEASNEFVRRRSASGEENRASFRSSVDVVGGKLLFHPLRVCSPIFLAAVERVDAASDPRRQCNNRPTYPRVARQTHASRQLRERTQTELFTHVYTESEQEVNQHRK